MPRQRVNEYPGETKIDQHIARALEHASADNGNSQFVIDSLKYILEERAENAFTQLMANQQVRKIYEGAEDTFEELMKDPQLRKIYESQNQQPSGGSQNNRSQSNRERRQPDNAQQDQQPNRERRQPDNAQQATSNSGLPKTQLILTVGTNPLPVWVAWKHLVELGVLKDKFRVSEPIQVRLVYTEGTEKQKRILQSKCGNLPECPNGAQLSDTVKRDIQTSPGDPDQIRKDIQRCIFGQDGKSLPKDIKHIHVHYTGGTQAMGVETVAAIESKIANNTQVQFSSSYLNARDDSGVPKIVSRPNGILVPDTRSEICLDLSRTYAFLIFSIGDLSC